MIDREIGPYRVKEQLPRRGPGRAFGGVHTVFGRKVTIREVPCDSFRDEEGKRAFLRGAKIVQRHAPGGVGVVHLCQAEEGSIFLVTEYLSGSLEELVQRKGALPAERVIPLCRSVLEGVRFLHENGIVHGNLGAESVAFAEDGSAKVVEWGICRRPDLACYLSPEVAAGKAPEAADDLYAVGVLLKRVAGADGVKGMEEVVSKALAADPVERFSSAGEFLNALEEAQPAQSAGEGEAPELLTFPGRRVPWTLLFGLMTVPLIFAYLTRPPPPLPVVRHHPPTAARGTEGDPHPGSLPGLLPVRKERSPGGEGHRPLRKEPSHDGTAEAEE